MDNLKEFPCRQMLVVVVDEVDEVDECNDRM